MRNRIALALATLAAALVVPAAHAGNYTDGIAAIVNGEVITIFDIVRQTRQAEASLAARFSGQEYQDRIADVRRQMAQQLIDNELIYAEFKEREVKLPAELIDGSLDDIVRERAGGDWQKFEDQLSAEGGTLADFRGKLEKRLAVDVMLNETVRRPAKVAPEEVVAFFQAHGAELGKPSRLHLQIVTVKKEGREPAALDAKVKAIADRLAAGEDFAAVAKALSEDPSAERGGDLGWIETASGRQDFVTAVKDLAPGAIAPPLVTPEAVYVLRLVETQAGEAATLDDSLKNRIESLLRAQKQDERFLDFISRLRKKFYVKTFF